MNTQSEVKLQHIMVLVEVNDSNINGDPNSGNAPRTDPETSQALVSDVCWKRKIRDTVALTLGADSMYIRHRGILSQEHKKAYDAIGQKAVGKTSNDKARAFMCENYFDVRAFGALMTTGDSEESVEEGVEDKAHLRAKNARYNCGAVRGPVQVSFGRSLDAVTVLEHAITRVALTNKDDGAGSTEGADGILRANSGQMGSKYTIPYGLVKFTVSVNPFLAKDTGYSNADNDLLLNALVNMFEFDESSARTGVAVRKVYVFTHENELGNAPKHKLVGEDGVVNIKSLTPTPRRFSDYEITVGEVPSGVKLEELVDGLSTGKPKTMAAHA